MPNAAKAQVLVSRAARDNVMRFAMRCARAVPLYYGSEMRLFIHRDHAHARQPVDHKLNRECGQ